MISIKNLKKSFDHQVILQGLSLEIPSGTLFALLGPNGSGKTTLLKSLLGMIAPAPGSEIYFDGQNTIGQVAFKKQVGFMSQFPKFPPHLRVREFISLMEKLRGKTGNTAKLISDLGIDQFWEKPIGKLSGGMVQKVNILQCFMFDHASYILDEPTSGLDPMITFYLKNLLREKRGKATVVFTSHVMAEVEELADLMALMIEGKIYTVISPEALKKQSGSKTLEMALHDYWKGVAP